MKNRCNVRGPGEDAWTGMEDLGGFKNLQGLAQIKKRPEHI